ncbi:hypothetical protein Kazakh3190_15280 [Helicobacter pylori]
MLTKLIEKLNHERKNAIKNGIYHLIQIKFSYNSNRIEGSSLNYEQTAHIFDKSALITEKNENIKLDDIFETINHFECVNYLLESYKEPLSLEYFKTLHKIVKHPNAKAIGLPRLMLPVGKVWFSLCVPNHRDFTEFELQRIPYRSHTSYLQRRNFAHFLR